jgi:hypothetical protein
MFASRSGQAGCPETIATEEELCLRMLESPAAE